MTLPDLEARFAHASTERTHHRDQASWNRRVSGGPRFCAGYTLVCSLEPCPMCMARLVMAGVQTVKFLAYDELAGMVNQLHQFPTAWKRLWQRQEFVQADVSESLKQFGRDVFSLNLETCRQKLLSR
jgi:tRNA(Arg) A34 adenosine deaminase TadA